MCDHKEATLDIAPLMKEHSVVVSYKYDMIKEKFLTPLSVNSEMLHVDANPIRIGCLVTEL